MRFPDDFIHNDDNSTPMPATLAHLWNRKGYAVMKDTQLLMLHRAVIHKMLSTSDEVASLQLSARLEQLSEEMHRRVVSAGVELVP